METGTSGSGIAQQHVDRLNLNEGALACLECLRAVNNAMTHCLERGGELSDVQLIRLFQDTAAICITTADMLSRGSELHELVCRSCAHICSRCAEECREWGDERELKICADAAQRCADACRQLSTH